MARVELSGIFTSITGQLGGSVIQNSLGGLQMRTRVSPRDPKTSRQQEVRSNESYLRFKWNEISAQGRSSFIDNAPAGQSGISFFLKTNQRVFYTGNNLIDIFSPTTMPVIADPKWKEEKPNELTVLCETDLNPLPANVYINFFASKPLAAGKSFISPGEYRFIYSSPPGTHTEIAVDLTELYIALYREVVEGELIGIRVYMINVDSGSSTASQFFQGYVVV